MEEFNLKKLVRAIIDIVLVLLGIVWVLALLTFANGTMDNSMAAEEVTRYQIEALIRLVVANVIMVILFKIRKKITEKLDEEAK